MFDFINKNIKQIKDLYNSVYAWGEITASTIYHGTAGLLKGGETHETLIEWSLKNLEILGVKLKAEGLENVYIDRPQMFFANHQSNVDIFLLGATVPVSFYWIYKHTLNYFPVLGWHLKHSGHISIERTNRAKAIESLTHAAKLIATGKNITVFPEGTRSGRKELLPFKKGVFHLAIESQVPIIPVTIINSWKIMTKKSVKINPTDVEIIFHKPIFTKDLTVENLEELMLNVKKSIESAL